ncbi:MAG TPA: benzoate-CoA ligase family protein [Gemmatimonadales bacterium]|jgi:benzoate-CoA ligase family protein
MVIQPPEQLNIADHFLDARIREDRGDRVALITDRERMTYREVQALANRYANILRQAGVEPEQRVIIALPDGPAYVGALFGILKIGAVVVMVNPELKADTIEYFVNYTRAVAALVHCDAAPAFRAAAANAPLLKRILMVGDGAWEQLLSSAPETANTFPSHRDDAAIWLFSGGTTGHPKAVVQTHASFANTTDCYARQVIQYREDDVTISVPKLFFGYATGSNLFFPFSAGGSSVLFPERCTADCLFGHIARHRPTILITVPTMVNHMVTHPEAARQNLSSLRLATSAGEGLPAELHARWDELFGVPLLDGLGTAEMWHIFLSNRPGRIRRGTLGEVVPGFEVRVRDNEGHDLPDGEPGWLWVRGNSRAIGYWQHMEKTRQAFQGEWFVSGDIVCRQPDGYFTYCGRGDDLLKVAGKWLSPQEVENCLMQHPLVLEAAVVGVADPSGLTKPHAYVVARERRPGLEEDLKSFVRDRLEPYKHPRQITLVDSLPRTHLGKVDRGKLRQG